MLKKGVYKGLEERYRHCWRRVVKLNTRETKKSYQNLLDVERLGVWGPPPKNFQLIFRPKIFETTNFDKFHHAKV